MRKRKFVPYIIPELHITHAGSEGKSIGRHQDKVVMVDFGAPGDVAEVKVTSSKKSFSFAAIQNLITPSADRVDTFCTHFGTCGGCKWQHMSYDAQLRYKQQQVFDAFERIGKFPFPAFEPIAGSAKTTYYRNKCEFSFTSKKWLTNLDQAQQLTETEHKGLGYHIPGRFDKVFDVEHCYLQHPIANDIRNAIRDYGKANQLPFYNLYVQEGFLRNIILRNNEAGEWMLIVCFGYEDEQARIALLTHIQKLFPQITSLLYVINTKKNDTIHDLDVHVFSGDDYLLEFLEDLKFKIGPQSFFQTNTQQTLTLYSKARALANLTGNEIVYDLYTGVGTIALFVAKHAKKVVGVEYVPSAIEDAKQNAALNNISHTHFFAGDMKDVLNDAFVAEHGKPDVIITDPPRAGMHEDVVNKILEIAPKRVVYVSCNPATQARDIALMQHKYEVTCVQPVDMFPHTHHVENIALLELKPE
ncbi:MAG: 23S rRNA (uracil(1939)-C(5))-methyltransferase RlmD [Bacteroidota bacterium]